MLTKLNQSIPTPCTFPWSLGVWD